MGIRPAAHSEKGEFMFEKRADQLESGRNSDVGKHAYDTPLAEWHDLRVITLGGTPGEGDSGGNDTEQPGGDSPPTNPDGSRGSSHYDSNPDDEFGNYV